MAAPNPFESVKLGRTPLHVTRLGFGVVSIAGIYEHVSDEQAAEVLDHAWDLGIRYYDTAPLYGYTLGERRLGHMLQRRDPAEYTITTKVGRLMMPLSQFEAHPEWERDWQALGSIDARAVLGEPDAYFVSRLNFRPVYDYSYDAVMRSVEHSFQRLGIDRIDGLWIHDPDNHYEQAISGAFPAMAKLREQGVVKCIGAGMNQAAMLARFAKDGDFDAFMCAGRYTLLDQVAMDELFPICEQKGITIVIGGAMNSGLLSDPTKNDHFNYAPAPQEWVDKALAIKAVCERNGVPLHAAALQFPYAHPVVSCLVAGVRTIAHLDDTVESLRFDIPDHLWEELKAEGLLRADAPTPVLRPADVPAPVPGA
jgi:D-threo-aldose 1-dehydrogenase